MLDTFFALEVIGLNVLKHVTDKLQYFDIFIFSQSSPSLTHTNADACTWTQGYACIHDYHLTFA